MSRVTQLSFKQWLVQTAALIGYSTRSENRGVSVVYGFSEFSRFWFGWYIGHGGSLNIQIRTSEREPIGEIWDDYRFRRMNEGVDESDVASAAKHEAVILEFFNGIRQRNSYTPCESMIHQRVTNNSRPDVCVQIGDKWVCDTCMNMLSLPPPSETPQREPIDEKEAERRKLTSRMRFAILERDGFRCNACGESPRMDSAVKLHIDHIKPIAEGGKTEESNLQVLCSRCNLAKGKRIVKQMELWRFA